MSELLAFIQQTEESFRRARLASLYSDFSLQRHTNPDGYASNVAAWQRALAHAALAGYIPPHSTGGDQTHQGYKSDLLVLRTSNALMVDLETREWGRPVALQCAIDEALRSNIMMPLRAFLTSSTTPFRRGWLPSPPSLSQVMTWGMKQVRGFVSGAEEHSHASGKLQPMELVLVDNLKETAKKLLGVASNYHNSAIDRIYSKELFMKRFSNILEAKTELSATDFEVLLTFLARDESVILYDGKTIKFKSTTDNTQSITQEDRTIASLKTLIANLTAQVASLDKKIKELSLSAQDAVRSKNRILALSALRSRKLAEQNLKQRTDTLLQLEEVYLKIEQAADQVDIVRIMEASTGTLRALHAQVGGVEKVEDVVEELREEMGKVDEVGTVMNEVAPAVDEGELDDELQEMENEERSAREAAEAESTRRKLAELDQLSKQAATAAEKEHEKNPALSDSDLEQSIGRLSQMSIRDDSKQAGEKREEEGQIATE